MTIAVPETDFSPWVASWAEVHRFYFPDYESRWQQLCARLGEISSELVFEVPSSTPRLFEASDGNQSSTINTQILDIGCGLGNLTAHLVTAFPTAKVQGVDLDPRLIEVATKLFEIPGNLSFRVANVLNRSFAEGFLIEYGAVDAIVTSATLHYFSPANLKLFASNCALMLKPGGVLLGVDVFTDTSRSEFNRATENAIAEPRIAPWNQWWQGFSSLDAVKHISEPVSDVQSPKNKEQTDVQLSTAEHVQVLLEAGFAEIRADHIGMSTMLTARKPTT